MPKTAREDDIEFLHSLIVKLSDEYTVDRLGPKTEAGRLVRILRLRSVVAHRTAALETAAAELRKWEEAVSSGDAAVAAIGSPKRVMSVEEWLSERELSTRTEMCLRGKFGSSSSLVDFLMCPEQELLKHPQFGRKSLNELKELLNSCNVFLGMSAGAAEEACQRLGWIK